MISPNATASMEIKAGSGSDIDALDVRSLCSTMFNQFNSKCVGSFNDCRKNRPQSLIYSNDRENARSTVQLTIREKKKKWEKSFDFSIERFCLASHLFIVCCYSASVTQAASVRSTLLSPIEIAINGDVTIIAFTSESHKIAIFSCSEIS